MAKINSLIMQISDIIKVTNMEEISIDTPPKVFYKKFIRVLEKNVMDYNVNYMITKSFKTFKLSDIIVMTFIAILGGAHN